MRKRVRTGKMNSNLNSNISVKRPRTVRSSELPDIFQSTILAVMTSSLCIKSENWNFGPVRLLQIETFTFFEIEQKISKLLLLLSFLSFERVKVVPIQAAELKTWSLYSNVNQFCNSKGWSGRSGRMITSHWGLNGLCATDGKKNNWGKSNFDISHKIQPLVR